MDIREQITTLRQAEDPFECACADTMEKLLAIADLAQAALNGNDKAHYELQDALDTVQTRQKPPTLDESLREQINCGIYPDSVPERRATNIPICTRSVYMEKFWTHMFGRCKHE